MTHVGRCKAPRRRRLLGPQVRTTEAQRGGNEHQIIRRRRAAMFDVVIIQWVDPRSRLQRHDRGDGPKAALGGL